MDQSELSAIFIRDWSSVAEMSDPCRVLDRLSIMFRTSQSSSMSKRKYPSHTPKLHTVQGSS